MKKFKYFNSLVLSILFVAILPSCDKNDDVVEGEVKGEMDFFAGVEVNPSCVKNGTEIELCLQRMPISSGEVSVGISTSSTINGKNVIKCIDYYIDDIKVASSNDEKNDYNVSYKVSELELGQHTVSAHCVSNFKYYTINEHISTATLIVE